LRTNPEGKVSHQLSYIATVSLEDGILDAHISN